MTTNLSKFAIHKLNGIFAIKQVNAFIFAKSVFFLSKHSFLRLIFSHWSVKMKEWRPQSNKHAWYDCVQGAHWSGTCKCKNRDRVTTLVLVLTLIQLNNTIKLYLHCLISLPKQTLLFGLIDGACVYRVANHWLSANFWILRIIIRKHYKYYDNMLSKENPDFKASIWKIFFLSIDRVMCNTECHQYI